jgi:RNA polymerase sigma-70 factor (ECF subfamily)
MTPAHDNASMDSREREPNLSALVESAAALAQSDFEALYTRHVPTLIAWVGVRTSGLRRGAVDAEDVVQETWVRALESFTRFDPGRGAFRSWLIGIAQHVLLEALRRRAGKPFRDHGSEMNSGISQCPAIVTTISRAVARADSVARFLAFVETLPSEDRDLIALRGLENRDFADVARHLQVSFDAAEKRWQRLLARLRERAIGRELVVDF